MTTLTHALRAFKHPLTLLSIAILILNDHVLKVFAPSWLTGKLSDFAGLFFFPFLLTAVLALPLKRLSPHRVMALAGVITATWFTVIKTFPLATALTESMAAQLLGGRAQIILDPTDLIALPMIWLAWRLWLRLEQTPTQTKFGWEAYVILGVSAWATMATSCGESPFVGRLKAETDVIRAAYLDDSRSWHVFQSLDGGQTWNGMNLLTSQVDGLSGYPDGDNTVCDQSSPLICYRISGQPLIERSTDGGITWQVDWSAPVDRMHFFRRLADFSLLGCSLHPFTLEPQDLVLTQVNGQTTVVVSMGYDGVLSRTPGGEWSRFPVAMASPTPYSATSFSMALATVKLDIAFSLMGVLLVAHLLLDWSVAVRSVNPLLTLKRSTLYSLLAYIVGVWALILVETKVISLETITSILNYIPGIGVLMGIAILPLLYLLPFQSEILAVVVLVKLLGFGIRVRRHLINKNHTPLSSKTIWQIIALVTLAFSVICILFLLWAYGQIVLYQASLILAWSVGLLTLFFGLGVIYRQRNLG